MTQPSTRRWQFSLLTLLLAMSGVALVCLALRTPNEFWATAVFAAAVFSLGFAALAAVYRSGRSRAFAIGFVVFGAGFWTLVYLGEVQMYGPYGTQQRFPSARWSTQLFALLHKDSIETQTVMGPVYQTAVYSAPTPAVAPPAIPVTYAYVSQQIHRPRYSVDVFNDIFQQSLVMLLGVLGGIVAQWLYATRKEPSPATVPPV